jgi:hypothetical protein
MLAMQPLHSHIPAEGIKEEDEEGDEDEDAA